MSWSGKLSKGKRKPVSRRERGRERERESVCEGVRGRQGSERRSSHGLIDETPARWASKGGAALGTNRALPS